MDPFTRREDQAAALDEVAAVLEGDEEVFPDMPGIERVHDGQGARDDGEAEQPPELAARLVWVLKVVPRLGGRAGSG